MDVVNNTDDPSNNQTIQDEKIGLGTVQKAGLGIFFTFALIGIASNTAMIQVYKKKDLKVRFNCLMLSLAVFDLLTILLFILTAILQVAVGPNAILLFVDGASFLCSAYTMTLIALERYLALCRNT